MYISSIKDSGGNRIKIEEFKNSTLYKIENGKIVKARVLARQPYEEPKQASSVLTEATEVLQRAIQLNMRK